MTIEQINKMHIGIIEAKAFEHLVTEPSNPLEPVVKQKARIYYNLHGQIYEIRLALTIKKTIFDGF